MKLNPVKQTVSIYADSVFVPPLHVHYLLNILGYVPLEGVYSFSKKCLWLFCALKMYLDFSLKAGMDLPQNVLDDS